jgi:hypothetical protein
MDDFAIMARCSSCGFEFGNDPGTAAPVSFEEYQAERQADGSPGSVALSDRM